MQWRRRREGKNTHIQNIKNKKKKRGEGEKAKCSQVSSGDVMGQRRGGVYVGIKTERKGRGEEKEVIEKERKKGGWR